MSPRSLSVLLLATLGLACSIPESVQVPWQEEPQAERAPRGPAMGSPITPQELERQVDVTRLRNQGRAAVRHLTAER